MSERSTVNALRIIFFESGIETLLDYPKLRGKLWDLAPAEFPERERFSAIYETGAVNFIHEAVLDAANYKDNFAKALELLCKADCMTASVAEETLALFYDALGFPSEEACKDTQTLWNGDWEYTGEVENGKPHGRGREALKIDGCEYSTRDGMWLRGKPFGYFHSVDSLRVEAYSFCFDGWTVGRETRIWSADDIEVIDHGLYPPADEGGRKEK